MKRLLLFLSIATCAFGQATTGYHRVGQVLSRGSSGAQAVIQPYSSITVTATATGLGATIYSDPLLTAPISPSVVTADSSGNYDYYIPLDYCVTETISYPGSGGVTIPNICVISKTTTGNINAGLAGQLGYYATSGNSISGEDFATIAQGGTGASTAAGAWANILAGAGAQAPNTVFAGPSAGIATTPSFRALVSADIPNNAANTTGNAATATLATAASSLATTPAQCTVGQFSTGITATGDANCGSPSTSAITQINGGSTDGTTPAGGGIQPLTLSTVNPSPGACGDASHVCAINTDAKGRVLSQSAVAIPSAASPILARLSFVSCTVVDDGNAGEGCEATQAWGTTLPATYYMWCQLGTYASGGTIGNRGGFAINIASHTTTTFTYNIDSRQDAGRGIAALTTTCWATN